MTGFSASRIVMVDSQIRPSDVTKFPIIEAMLHVPREQYVPDDKRDIAYSESSIEVYPKRRMLEPRTFAKLLDALDITPDDVVLDIGCGLGYSTAVITRLASAVIALEQVEELSNDAQECLSNENVDNAAVIAGPLEEGSFKHGPYDVIIIEGGVEHIPHTLIDQLKEGGRIGAIFMKATVGYARIGYKTNNNINWRTVFDANAPILEGFKIPHEFSL